MEKKYQVFVSSTYRDLREERAAVIQALLEMKCIPVGMELFPATDVEQLTYIRQEIAESDYYIVIVGGCYGSVNPDTGRSYTEHELDIARELNIPCLAFFVDDINALPSAKRDDDPEQIKKLGAFRENVLRKLGKSWTDSKDLSGKVSRSLAQFMQTRKRPGWVRDNTPIERGVPYSEFSIVADQVRDIREQVRARLIPHAQTLVKLPEMGTYGFRLLCSCKAKIYGKEPIVVGLILKEAKKIFIRALGPSFTMLGDAGIPDPELRIYRGTALVTLGSVWSRIGSDLRMPFRTAESLVGALSLPDFADDSVALVDGTPGALSAIVTSTIGYSGWVLVEAYEYS